MSAPKFAKAQRRQVKVKLAVTGPSGSGKTYSALRLAKGIAGDSKVAFIDTENGSASLYSDRFDFDVLDVESPFTPDKYVEAIKAAVEAGYKVAVIDSFSHAWEAVLEKKTAMDARGGNSFTNWGVAGKDLKTILTEILQSDIHVVATMRSKTEYSQEKDAQSGKTVVKKLGLAPIMRDGIEYEFSTVFDVAMNHEAAASKDRTGLFDGKIFQITEATGRAVFDWLQSAPPPEPKAAPVLASQKQVDQLASLATNEPGATRLKSALAKAGAAEPKDLTTEQAEKTIAWIRSAPAPEKEAA
jgi:nucleoside-triphosphatase THEP1